MPCQGNSHKEMKQFFTILLNTADAFLLTFSSFLVSLSYMAKLKMQGECLSFSQHNEAEMLGKCKILILVQFSTALNLLIVFI